MSSLKRKFNIKILLADNNEKAIVVTFDTYLINTDTNETIEKKSGSTRVRLKTFNQIVLLINLQLL